MPLDIAIIGAGISGLAAAIALSRDGHTVNVYERRPNPQQLSGSGLQIQPSAIKILRRWGLLDGFAKVAHESGSVKMRRYQDGNLIAAQMRKGSRGQWYCLRNALRQYLFEAAVDSGAHVHFNSRVQSIDFDAPSLTLENDTIIRVDVIIAADGTNSFVRQTMAPSAQRELTDCYTFQCNISKEAMYTDKEYADLYEDPATQLWLGQNSFSFMSVVPNQGFYDLQVIARHFGKSGRDRNPERLLEPLENLDIVDAFIDDWAPHFKTLLSKATTGFFKWRNTEVPRLSSALAEGGKVILIGDAYHGLDPSAGFGTALSLEDGFTIALIIAKCPHPSQLSTYLGIFARIMKERSDAIAVFSRSTGDLLSTPDGPLQQARDRQMSRFDPNGTLNAKPNRKAKYGTPEWQAYLDDYDPVATVEEALAKHVAQTELRPGIVSSRM